MRLCVGEGGGKGEVRVGPDAALHNYTTLHEISNHRLLSLSVPPLFHSTRSEPSVCVCFFFFSILRKDGLNGRMLAECLTL